MNNSNSKEKKLIFHPDKYIIPTEEVYRIKPGEIVKSSVIKKEFKYYEFVVDSDKYCYSIQ